MIASTLHGDEKPVGALHTAADGGQKEVKRKQLLTSFENELTATKKRFFTGGSSNFFELWTRFADKFIRDDDKISFYARIVDSGNYLAANGDFYAASWQCFQFALELMQLHGSSFGKPESGDHATHISSKQFLSIKSIQTAEELRKAMFAQEFPDKATNATPQKQTSQNRRRRAAADNSDILYADKTSAPAAARLRATRLTELKLNAVQGYLDAEIEVLFSNDPRLRFPASLAETLALLKSLRCVMQLFAAAHLQQQQHQQLDQSQQQMLQRYFVYFYNATVLTFKVCKALMSAGFEREALDNISWTSVAFDSNPTSNTPVNAIRFLNWRTNLHYTAAKCLISLDCTNDACEFIRNWAVKCVAETHAKEYERSGAQRPDAVKAVFRLACHRLNTIILRQRILRLKRKPQQRLGAAAAANIVTPTGAATGGRKRFHFGRSAAAAANDKHRSQVERLMCERFEGFTAQLVAIVELLDRATLSTSMRVLETCPLLQQEDIDLHTEIFEYGYFLLFGTSHSGAGGGGEANSPRARASSRSTPEAKTNTAEQSPPPVNMKILLDCDHGIAVSNCLIAASADGGHEVPLHSCIDFAMLCFNYEQFELFKAVHKKLVELTAVATAAESSHTNGLIASRMRILTMLSLTIEENILYHIRRQSSGKPATLLQYAKQNPNMLTADIKTRLSMLLTYFLISEQSPSQQQQQHQSNQPPISHNLLSQHPDAETLRDFALLLWYQLSHTTIKLNVYNFPNHYPLEVGENATKNSANALEQRIRQLHVVWSLFVRLDYHLVEPAEMISILYELVAAMDVFLHTVNMMHKRVNISSRFGAARLNLSTPTATLSEMVQLLRHGLSIVGSSRAMFKRAQTEVNLPSIQTGAGGARHRLLYNFLLDVYTELYFVHQRLIILYAMLADGGAKAGGGGGGESNKTTLLDAAAHGRNWKARALYATQAALVSYAVKTSTTPAAATVMAERFRSGIGESCLAEPRAMLDEAFKSLRKASDEEALLGQNGGVETSLMKTAHYSFGDRADGMNSDLHAITPPDELDNDESFDAANESGPPPPPIAIEITDTSITLMPAPYKPIDGVAYYKILGREFADGVKVRLKDLKLPGTNVDRRISTSTNCYFRITGLRPNQRYIFACAAFDAGGRLIWNSVGRTTRPLTAAHPLSLDYCMGMFCRAACHIGAVNLCRSSFKNLWEKFCGLELGLSVAQHVNFGVFAGRNDRSHAEVDLSYHNQLPSIDAVTAHAEQLALQVVTEENEKDLSLIIDGLNMSSIQVRNFVVCCLLEAEVCMSSPSSALVLVGSAVVSEKTVDQLSQHNISRIKVCLRLAAAMRLAVWLNDDALATDALMECILILTPLFHSKIYAVKEVLQIFHWCHTVLTHIRRDVAASLCRMMQKICRYWPQLMIGNLGTLSSSAAAAAAATAAANRTSIGGGRPNATGGRNTTNFSDASSVNNNARVLIERFASVIQIFTSFYYNYVTLLMTMKQPAAAIVIIREARITMSLLLEQIIVSTATQTNVSGKDNKKVANAPNTALADQHQQQSSSAAGKFLTLWQTNITEFMDEVLSELKIVPHDVANLLADRFASEQRRSNNVIIPLSTANTTRRALVPARTASAMTKRDQCDYDVKQMDYAFLEIRHELDWSVLDASTNDPEFASLMTDEFAQLLARSVHAGAGEAYEQVSAKFRRRSRFVEAVAILCATKVNDVAICDRMRGWIFDLRKYLCKRNELQLSLRQTYFSIRERLHESYPNEFSPGLIPAVVVGVSARNNNEERAAAFASTSMNELEPCKTNLLPIDFKLQPSPPIGGGRPAGAKAQTLAPPPANSGKKKAAAPAYGGGGMAAHDNLASGSGKEVDKIRQYAKFSHRDPSTLSDDDRHQYDAARTRAGDALTLFIFERMREWKRGRQYRAVYDAERPHLMTIYFTLGQASLNALVRDAGTDIRQNPNKSIFNSASPFGSNAPPLLSICGFSEDSFSMDAFFTLNASGWLIERPCDVMAALLQKEQQQAGNDMARSPGSVASGGTATSCYSRILTGTRRIWLALQRAIVLGCRSENWQSVQHVLSYFWESVHIVLSLIWSNNTDCSNTLARFNEILHLLWKHLLIITQHLLGLHESLQQLWIAHQTSASSKSQQQNSFASSAASAGAAANVAYDIWNGENWLSGINFFQQPTLTEDRSCINVALLMQTCLNCIELGFRQQRWTRVTELCRPTYEMFVRIVHLGDVLFPLDVAARKMIMVTTKPRPSAPSPHDKTSAGSRLTANVQQHAATLKVGNENSSNLTVGMFAKASSAMSSKLKAGGGVSPSQTAVYADAMQVGRDYRAILQQESVILRQFKYCRLLRWRAQLGMWRDKMLSTFKIAMSTTTASPTTRTNKAHPSPNGTNKVCIPAIPVIAPEFSIMQTTVHDVLYPALILPHQRDAPFLAYAKLVDMLEKYEIKQHSQFLALVYNEMGDTLLMRSSSAVEVASADADRARAYTYYNKALECITNIKEAWHSWKNWIAQREIHDVAQFLFEHCGVWGCIMSAMLAFKIAENSNVTRSNMSVRYNCYSFASFCWLATLRANFAHPVHLIDFRNYSFGHNEPVAQHLPNLSLLNIWFSHTDSTAAVMLESLCCSLDEIMCNYDYLLALPLCSILRHLACDVFDSPALLVESWLAKLEALIGLHQYSEATGVLHLLMEANFLTSCSKFTTECGGGDAANAHRVQAVAIVAKPQLNVGGNFTSEQRSWFNSAKRVGEVENIDALRYLIEMKFAKHVVDTSTSLCPVYSVEHFHRISILQADLLVALARSVYGLPEDVDIHGYQERLGGRFFRPVHRGMHTFPAAPQTTSPLQATRTGGLTASGQEQRRPSTAGSSTASNYKRGAPVLHSDAPNKPRQRAGSTLTPEASGRRRSSSPSTERRSSTAAAPPGAVETAADYDLRTTTTVADLLSAEAAPSEREIKGLLLKIAYQLYSTAVDELHSTLKSSVSHEAECIKAAHKKNLLRAAYYRGRRGVAAVLNEFHLYDQAFGELLDVSHLLSADVDCAKDSTYDRTSAATTSPVEIRNKQKQAPTSSSRSSSAMRRQSVTAVNNSDALRRRPRGVSLVANDPRVRRRSSARNASVAAISADKGDAFQFTRASLTATATASRKVSPAVESTNPQILAPTTGTSKRGATTESPGVNATNDFALTNTRLLMYKQPLRGGLGLWFTNQMLLDDTLMQLIVLCYGIRTPRFACAGEESSWLDETNVCLDRLISDAQATAHVHAQAFGLLYRMRIQMLSGVDFRELAKCTNAGINLLRQLPRLPWLAQITYAELLLLHADVQASLPHASSSYVLETLVEAHAVLNDQLESVGVYKIENETLPYQHKCNVGHSFLHSVKRKFDQTQAASSVVSHGENCDAINVCVPLKIPHTKHPKHLTNFYLTQWQLIARIKMRIGMTFVFDIKRRYAASEASGKQNIGEPAFHVASTDGGVKEQLNETLRVLQQALKISQDCMLQSAALEAEIAYNCGCVSRLLYTHWQIGSSWRLCMAYLVRAIQCAYCGVHDIKLIHQCYMEIAQLCYDSRETASLAVTEPGANDTGRESLQEANSEWESLAHSAILLASHSSTAEKSLTDILTRGDCLHEAIPLDVVDLLPDVILFECIISYDRKTIDHYMNSLMPAAEILDTMLLSSLEQQGTNSKAIRSEPVLSWIRLIRYIHVLRSRLNWNFVISLADVPEFDIEQASAFVAEHNKIAAKAQQQNSGKTPEQQPESPLVQSITPATTGPVSILASSNKQAASPAAVNAASWKIGGLNKQTVNIVAPKLGNDFSHEGKRNAAVHASSAERNPLAIRMPAYCVFEEQEYEVLQRILISKADGYAQRATAPFPSEFVRLLNAAKLAKSHSEEDERIRFLGSGHFREEYAEEQSQFDRILRRINSDETTCCVALGSKEYNEGCELIVQWHCDLIQPFYHCLSTGIWPREDKMTQLQQPPPEIVGNARVNLRGNKSNASLSVSGGISISSARLDEQKRAQPALRESAETKKVAKPYMTAIASAIPAQALARVHANLSAMTKQAELIVGGSRMQSNRSEQQNETKIRKAQDMIVSILLQATSEIDKILKRTAARSFQGLQEMVSLFSPNDILCILREFNELFTPSTGGKALHPFVVAFIMSIYQDVTM